MKMEFSKFFENAELNKLITDEQLSFFFSFEDEIYGATEDGRLAFAYIKDPKDQYTDELTIPALNLKDKKQRIFTKKDVKNMKVLSKEDVV